MDKINYKKDYKEIYLPKQKPSLVRPLDFNYVCVEYLGNPNNEEFQLVMNALYSMAYTIKMKSKKLSNYYEYVVFPLEGLWTFQDINAQEFSKDNFKGLMMIRQPDFVNQALFEEYKKLIKLKNPENQYIDKLEFKNIKEPLSIQMLHIGSYDNEASTFEIMENYAKENNYVRSNKMHKEIYLSDPRKVDLDRLKTVLRFEVKENK